MGSLVLEFGKMRRSLFLTFLLVLELSLNAGQIRFTDVTAQAGIRWTHVNGATEEKFLIETMGGGGAFLDFDNDGWLDIYLVNSGAHKFSAPGTKGRNALYRNDRDGTFTDVTAIAGVAGDGYGNGVAVGDFDNNGFLDLYVTNYGRNTLYKNQGNGTFRDVTGMAGASSEGWSTSAAFFDADRDGDLDLLVCNYLQWSPDLNVWCGERSEGYRSYCHPDFFSPIPNVFLKNNGNGTFSDQTRKAGLDVPGKALGVIASDFDLDGDIDLYIANDAVPNFLFENDGRGSFQEVGLLADVGYGPNAQAESGMGVDSGDYDLDGRPDLVVTNIDYELNNLYRGGSTLFFTDVTNRVGLGRVGLLTSGFGVRFTDADVDGDLDLIVLNGHPLDNIELYHQGVEARALPLVLSNEGGSFQPVTDAGEAFSKRYAGRALATGDFDNDGDPDLLFVNNGEAPILLRNDNNPDNWFGLHLIGTESNRDAVGARVVVQTDRRILMRERTGGGSYQAAHDPRLIFGLDSSERVLKIEVLWPTGKTRRLPLLRSGVYHVVREGVVRAEGAAR